MFAKSAVVTIALLGIGCSAAKESAAQTQNTGTPTQNQAAQASKPAAAEPEQLPAGGPPSEANRQDALSYSSSHPFVLGDYNIPETNIIIMRCFEIASGSGTSSETNQVVRFTKLTNRCSFPIRLAGEIGTMDEARKVCTPKLRLDRVFVPFDEYYITEFTTGNCFNDVNELSVPTG
jgi:hypothetical protein